MKTPWVLLGSLSAFVSVAAGAFGAHALAARLDARLLAIWQTAAQYQLAHALALIALGAWMQGLTAPAPCAAFAGWAFVTGSVIFSGSLYALALTDVRWLGAITPVGGLSFLAGWAALALSAWQAGTR